MILAQLFDSNGYLSINKVLLEKLGISEAVIFSVICSKYTEMYKLNQLHYDMVAITIEEFKQRTGMSYHKQIRALDNLENAGLINTVLDGMPAKKYIKINMRTVLEFFENNEDELLAEVGATNSENSSFQIFQKHSLYNNISNSNSDNNTDNNGIISENMSIHVSEHTNDVLEGLKKELNMPNITEENKRRAKENGFLGSVQADKGDNKKGRYQQCAGLIYVFADEMTKDIQSNERRDLRKKELQDLLFQYLNMLFEDKAKPVYINMWRGLLAKLKNVVAQGNEITAVIKQSIERGYKSFYPINQSFKTSHSYSPNEQDLIDDINSTNNSDDEGQEISDRTY